MVTVIFFHQTRCNLLVGFKSMLSRRHEDILKKIVREPSPDMAAAVYTDYLAINEEYKFASQVSAISQIENALYARSTNMITENARIHQESMTRDKHTKNQRTMVSLGRMHTKFDSGRQNAQRIINHVSSIENNNPNKPDSQKKDSCKISKRSNKSGRISLGDKLKEVNERFLNTLESQYSESNKKQSPLAIQLANVYIQGKRVPQNYLRAIEILSTSVLAEAKFMLVQLAFQNGYYSDAFHYLQFFSFSKCSCGSAKAPAFKKLLKGKAHVKAPNAAIATLEMNKSKCFKHNCDSMRVQMTEHLGKKEATRCYREGASLQFSANSFY